MKETKKETLIKELKKGECSGFVEDFNGDVFLKYLHRKHLGSDWN